MKYFILVFISLITLIIFASYGLIQTSSADKETVRIAKEYGGIYVFDKEIRDEIIALQKQELIERKKVNFDDPNFVKKNSSFGGKIFDSLQWLQIFCRKFCSL